jgi:hypothetical protein
MTQDEILYMGFDATSIGLPADFVLTDYSKVRRCPAGAPSAAATARAHGAAASFQCRR